MPPQRLLVICSYLPTEWQVRFIDENKAPAKERDYAWADAVFISGMHVQRLHILNLAINERAHVHGKVTVLGGPSASASPEWYSDVDILPCGELGDATDRLIRRLDASIHRPDRQEIYTTAEFACEATLNLAQCPKMLEAMREAYFCTLFCGIETPEEVGLDMIRKPQNKREPILESVRHLNSYGLEVVSGIILGIDSDTPATGEAISRFTQKSAIPMLTVNMLHVLPKTPLWRRLEASGRLVNIAGRESNVEFLLRYQEVEKSNEPV